jgi:hypothetical protein
MQKGDMVFVMNHPMRPILGKHNAQLGGAVELINHGTPALILEREVGQTRLLIEGMMLWVPNGFLKVTNEEG